MRITALAALTLFVAGCPGTTRCTEGMAIACACTDGRTGAQTCRSDGTFGACECGGSDAGVDAPSGDVSIPPSDTAEDAPRDAGPPPCVRDVDLLFEIDTSNSMFEEQALLRAELPRLVRVLATGDRNGDGTPDFEPAQSLHLGVITPDMGAGTPPAGETVPTCNNGLGDDGILQNRVRAASAGCPTSYPSGIFAFRAGVDDADTVAGDFACVANVGTGGCGFEQQLEAALKAVSPAARTPWVRGDYVPPAFALGTTGHGDGPNDGFVRDGSLLAITIVTDEDDCSVPSHDLFYMSTAAYRATPLNLRCTTHDDALHPISRFRDGFLQLRDDPRLLVFTAIAGTPTDATFGDSVAGYDMLLDHPDMANRVSPGAMTVDPACEAPATGRAFPARRLVETARELNAAGARTHVGSICNSSYSVDINAIIDAIEAGAPSCM